MKIRVMEKTDIAATRLIAYDAWRDTYSHFIPVEIQVKVLKEAYSEEKMDIRLLNNLNLVVEIENKMVGYAFFSGDIKKEDVYLESLYIHPSYQRRGIGKALIDYGVNCYLQPKTLSLTVYNQNASIKFYEKEGFEKIGETEGDFFGHPIVFIKMIKSL